MTIAGLARTEHGDLLVTVNVGDAPPGAFQIGEVVEFASTGPGPSIPPRKETR